MRVLYVSGTDGVHDRRMIDAWEQHGVDVTNLVLDAAAPDIDLVAETAERWRPDVVHAGPVPTIAFAVAQAWPGPLIAMSWGFDLMADAAADDTMRDRASAALVRADGVIVDNDAVYERARSLGAPEAAIVQFPWGVDHGRFHPSGSDLRAELGMDGAATCIVSVRRHEALYDVETLVRAFVSIRSKLRDGVLLLAGEGSLTPLLRRLVDDAGASDVVVFLGELEGERLASLYRTADLYVSTSTVDGSSISLLEAMASGTVPVVTDIPGNRQWTPDGVGVRFPVGDHARLGAVLLDLAADPARRAQMAEAAAQLAQDRADWRDGARRLRAAADLAIARHERKVVA